MGSGLPFLIRTSTEVCFPDPGARLFVVKTPLADVANPVYFLSRFTHLIATSALWNPSHTSSIPIA